MTNISIDFKNQRTSWTKYDIVRAIEVIYSVNTIEQYIKKEATIDSAILKSFLGMKTLSDPIPDYWITIQNYPREKNLFGLLALLFTHGEILINFARKYSTGNMKGVFTIDTNDKQETNIRSVLVETGAAEPVYRRRQEVPYDFSALLYNAELGKLFKKVINERFSRFTTETLSPELFYENCYQNEFHSALGLSKEQLRKWLEGEALEASYIKSLYIKDFLCISDDIALNFDSSKEIYFLGENGDGKSILLMALCLAFKGNYIIEKTQKSQTGKAVDLLSFNNDTKLKGTDEFDNDYALNNAIYLDSLFAYGTHRGRNSEDDFEKYGFMTLFSTEYKLNSPIAWLKDLKLSEDERGASAVPIAIEQLKDLFYNLLEKKVQIEITGSEVIFEENGYKLSLDELSEGYRGVIILICDLLYRLSLRQRELSENIMHMKGVVLIDEIDQHLHLKWQRTIVSHLRTLFPNIQFFFTTHSPTILQGASDDAVIYKVYRHNGNTMISEPYYKKNLNHLMLNTLVTSSLFGLNNSRLDNSQENAITDDTYLLYRINSKIESMLEQKKQMGINYFSEHEIDSIIDEVINKELVNDKNK